MDPFALMGISAGLNLIGGANQAAQKKREMLQAAEQTRYAPWTGQSGADLFKSAAQEDPMGGTLKGIAGTVAAGAAQSAANSREQQFRDALMLSKSDPNKVGGSFNRMAASPFGGTQMMENLRNPGFQVDDGSMPWNKMYSLARE